LNEKCIGVAVILKPDGTSSRIALTNIGHKLHAHLNDHFLFGRNLPRQVEEGTVFHTVGGIQQQ
jgi:hypothetical protein